MVLIEAKMADGRSVRIRLLDRGRLQIDENLAVLRSEFSFDGKIVTADVDAALVDAQGPQARAYRVMDAISQLEAAGVDGDSLRLWGEA